MPPKSEPSASAGTDDDDWEVQSVNSNTDDDSTSNDESVDLHSSSDDELTENDEDEDIASSASSPKSSTCKTDPTRYVSYAAKKQVKDSDVELEHMFVVGSISSANCTENTAQAPALPNTNKAYVRVDNGRTKDVYRGIITNYKNENTVWVLDTVESDAMAIKAFAGEKHKGHFSRPIASKSLQYYINGKDAFSQAEKKKFNFDVGAQVVLSTKHAQSILSKPPPVRKARKRPADEPADPVDANVPEEKKQKAAMHPRKLMFPLAAAKKKKKLKDNNSSSPFTSPAKPSAAKKPRTKEVNSTASKRALPAPPLFDDAEITTLKKVAKMANLMFSSI